ncbi:MAG: hypothetical protein KQI35_00190 [Bacteroidetes bacterium]|nr:hypothetical protein [Bacteroidota bacterium]
MKQDKLEQFIRANRREFDAMEPPDDLWNKIKPTSSIDPKKTFKKYALRIAAAITIFLAAWFSNDLIRSFQFDHGADEMKNLSPAQMEQYQLLMEAELFYTSRINQARSDLTILAGEDKTIIRDINSDLSELDEVFEDLKNDLMDNGDNQEVIEAMIQNYRIKLDILEQMLEQLRRSEINQKNEVDHEI